MGADALDEQRERTGGGEGDGVSAPAAGPGTTLRRRGRGTARGRGSALRGSPERPGGRGRRDGPGRGDGGRATAERLVFHEPPRLAIPMTEVKRDTLFREPNGRRPRRGVLEVHRPTDGSLVGEVPLSTPLEVLEAVERARSVQRQWVALDSQKRFDALEALVREIGERSDDIADVIVAETGKPMIEAYTEIMVVVELLKYYAEVAPRVMLRQWVKTGGWHLGKSAYTYREPYGVIGVITPWNYPFILPMDALASALFTGNAVVLKPSEYTPFTALEVKKLCREAGLPEGLVEVVPGDGATGEALVAAGVDKVFFTGSAQTGRRIMARAAQTLTPVCLELGGKDPALVLEDADVERAARGVVFGAFFNAGQTCLSTERVFVVDGIYDAFVERVTALAGELRAGTDGDYDVGPMITEKQLRVVEEHLEDALARGARVTVGGRRAEEGSNVFLPTVLVDVDASMKVVWEETFGPLLPVIRVKDEEEALRLVNVNPFGLFASIWTEDRERGEALAERLRAGGVSINDTLSHYAVPGLPVGGVGESGFGRRRGVAGLEEASRPRSVLLHGGRLHSREFWWFPYTQRNLRLVRALLEYRQARGVNRLISAVKSFFRRRARR